MTRYWLLAVLSQGAALALWIIGYQLDIGLLMPLALFVGTVIPASAIAADLGIRFLPAAAAMILRVTLLLANLAVAGSILVVHTVSGSGGIVFLSAVMTTIWGTVGLGVGLAAINAAMSFLMARNYFRVPSGRQKGIGALFVAVGTVGLTVPLLVLNLVSLWPLVALPAMILAVMGRKRLDL